MPRATAPILGVVAAGAVIFLTVIPYAFLTRSELAVYYGVGPVSPVVLSVFAAVALIALAGVAAGRTDAATGTGAAVVVGSVLTGLLLWWAIAAGDVVGGLAITATFDGHRWILVAVASIVPITAGWHAWTVLGPQGP